MCLKTSAAIPEGTIACSESSLGCTFLAEYSIGDRKLGASRSYLAENGEFMSF